MTKMVVSVHEMVRCVSFAADNDVCSGDRMMEMKMEVSVHEIVRCVSFAADNDVCSG